MNMINNNLITYISFSNFNRDGRMRELTNHLSLNFKINLIGFGKNPEFIPKNITLNLSPFQSNLINFFWFIYKSFNNISKSKFVLIDNRKAALIGFFLLPFLKKKILIQDVREFYTLDEPRSLVSKFGTVIEHYMIKKSDVVITANYYRSRLTKKICRLGKLPLVYENRRRFPEIKNLEKNNIDYLFDTYSKKKIKINSDKLNLISTSGFTVERECINVVEAAINNSNNVNLFFVGKTSPKNKKIIFDFLNKKKAENIFVIDPVTLKQLKIIVENMNVGIVNYSKRNRNNIYCASGKIYEFLSLGIPVLSTDNIPLKEFLKLNNCGISNNDFNFSIKEIILNYEFYRNNTLKFDLKKEIIDYNKNFVKSLVKLLKEKIEK